MTVDELIEELLKLKNEGKGEYRVKSCYYSDDFDLKEKPIIFDDEQVISL